MGVRIPPLPPWGNVAQTAEASISKVESCWFDSSRSHQMVSPVALGRREVAKYPKYNDGDFQMVDTKGEVLKLACCDCALVHYIGITIIDDSLVKVQFVRDQRATGQLRRHKYGFLQQ